MKSGMKIGLALSGGGFRATFFHVGVLQYLVDNKLLDDVCAMSSSSGGSVVAAMVGLHWQELKNGADYSSLIRAPLTKLARAGLRERIVRRIPLLWTLRALTLGKLRRRWPSTPTRLLAHYYDRFLFLGRAMDDFRAVSDGLDIMILATNASKGGIGVFGKDSVRFLSATLGESAPTILAGLTPISVAVAASSAFPAFFPPIELDYRDVGADDESFGPEWFTDAGVSDNLAFDSLLRLRPDLDLVVLSDAGRSRVPPRTNSFGLVRNALRSSDLMLFRISELARERAKSQPSKRVVSLSIAHTTSGVSGEAETVVQQPLEELRTDFDRFSVLEIEELIRHGWCVARDQLGAALPRVPSSAPPRRSRRASSPAIDARRLREGALRRIRPLDVRDWLSWAYGMALAIAIAFCLVMAPKIVDAALTQRDALRAERLSRGQLNWTKGRIPNPTFVDKLPEDANPGFQLLSEDRVWDLRLIHKASKGASPSTPGTAYMMRSATAVWNGEGEPVYRFRFLTSGRQFRAWCVGDRHDIEILAPKQGTTELSGDAVMRPYFVEVKLPDLAPGVKTVIQVQVESADAFVDRNNWWTGMRVTTAVDSISMRIVFPEHLPFRRDWTRFSMYPNETPAQSESFDGIVLNHGKNHELLWLLSGPRIGYTYRVDWDW